MRLPSYNAGMIEPLIDTFLQYRRSARNNAENTRKAYAADLAQFAEFIAESGATDVARVDVKLLRAFLASLQAHSYARSTLARKQAALRAFFRWARRQGHVATDPTRGLFSPRQSRKLPKF